jgi:hypothetical protein
VPAAPASHPGRVSYGPFWMLACATAVPGGAGRPGRADAWLHVLRPRSAAVEIAASPLGVHLRPELPLQLHQAPDPGAVSTDIGLDVGGPPLGWWPSRRRAAARTAAAAPRSAGPGPGRAKSPPGQPIELMFEGASGMLPTAAGRAAGAQRRPSRLWSGRSPSVRRAADGQQPTAVGISTTLREA